MIEGVVSSVLATMLVAAVAYLYRHGYLAEWWYVVSEWFPGHVVDSREPQLSVGKFRRSLIRRLVHDQSRTRIHRGQFGKSTSLAEITKYQKNPEELASKPRMYLTFWPTVILKSRDLAPRAVRLAVEGVRQLYENNRIAVRQAISREMLPQKQPTMVSYRHTMCGALFLYHQLGWNTTSSAVVDLMLDERNAWQNADGGWAHSDRDVVESDLWGSVYALRLLDLVLQNTNSFSYIAQKRAGDALAATLRYLTQAWQASRWSYGGAASEENAVLLFIDAAESLRQHDSALHEQVKSHIRSWLSPSGDLSDTYLKACHGVSAGQLYARMAYALFRGQENSSVWGRLFERVVRDGGDVLVSSEMAFMIDLSYEYHLEG